MNLIMIGFDMFSYFPIGWWSFSSNGKESAIRKDVVIEYFFGSTIALTAIGSDVEKKKIPVFP